MINLRLLAVAAALVLTLSGCFTNRSGDVFTNVELSEGNYRYVDTVSGHSTGFKFLGMGGEGAFWEAMENARRNAMLHDPSLPRRALANVTKDESSTYWFLGLVITDTVKLTADVIEFVDK